MPCFSSLKLTCVHNSIGFESTFILTETRLLNYKIRMQYPNTNECSTVFVSGYMMHETNQHDSNQHVHDNVHDGELQAHVIKEQKWGKIGSIPNFHANLSRLTCTHQ